MQLEEEYEEKQKYSRDKRELERKIEALSQQKPVRDKGYCYFVLAVHLTVHFIVKFYNNSCYGSK